MYSSKTRFIDSENSDKKFCPFWIVGFCKFHDKCYLEHAQGDCENNQCNIKSCHKRHRKQCKFGNKCKYFKKQSCQFLHTKENTNQQRDITKQIVDTEGKVQKLKEGIMNLKSDNEKKVNVLVKVHMQEMEDLEKKIALTKKN